MWVKLPWRLRIATSWWDDSRPGILLRCRSAGCACDRSGGNLQSVWVLVQVVVVSLLLVMRVSLSGFLVAREDPWRVSRSPRGEVEFR